MEQYIERVDSSCSLQEAEEAILYAAKNGLVIHQDERHRYVRYKNMVFPCAYLYGNHYKIKTTLTLELTEKFMEWVENQNENR